MERKHITRVLVTSALITGFAAGIAGVRPAAAGPIIPVSTCGTINAPGTYKLIKNVGSPGTCMVIRASNVSFNLNAFSIFGGGGTGRGVVIAPGVTSVVVANGQIKGGAIGVQDFGNNTQLLHLTVFNESQRGIVLKGTTGGRIMNDRFPGNAKVSVLLNATTGASVTQNSLTGSGGYGIWVRSSTNFTVTNNAISQSALAGIIVACTAGGIKNTLTCPASQGGTIAANKLVYSPHLGIAIDRGNTHIHLTENNVSGSGKFDLFDSNLGCGTDTWASDIFTTHNQACVK
jgi:parallel beta-helix repeat protein